MIIRQKSEISKQKNLNCMNLPDNENTETSSIKTVDQILINLFNQRWKPDQVIRLYNL